MCCLSVSGCLLCVVCVSCLTVFCCLCSVVCCMLSVFCRWLPAVCWVLFVACCLLSPCMFSEVVVFLFFLCPLLRVDYCGALYIMSSVVLVSAVCGLLV